MDWDSSICRICLKSESENTDIRIKVESIDFTYLDLFNSCTRLNAQCDDDLPKNICNICTTELFNSFEFMNKAVTSDQHLRTNLMNGKDVEYGEDFEEDPCVEESSFDNKSYFKEYVDVKDQIIDSVPENIYDEDIYKEERLLEDEATSEQECYENFEEVYEQMDMNGATEEKPTDNRSNCKKSENGRKSVQCKYCAKTLKRYSMSTHLKRCHKPVKLYLCNACPKTFPILNDLKMHLKTHFKERERNFVCTICQKGFLMKQTLNVHMNRHIGLKEFQCKVCPKKFTTKKSLQVHEFTHNRQNGQFICKYCDKRFPSMSDLRVHERFHTGEYPYKCELCHKSYAVKSHLTYHMAKHKGITYKCDQCDKEFMNRGSLTSHKYRHLDHMPHECPICKRGFPSPYKLNRHKCSHMPKENGTKSSDPDIEFDEHS